MAAPAALAVVLRGCDCRDWVFVIVIAISIMCIIIITIITIIISIIIRGWALLLRRVGDATGAAQAKPGNRS